jgi:hypothetical protein
MRFQVACRREGSTKVRLKLKAYLSIRQKLPIPVVCDSNHFGARHFEGQTAHLQTPE